MEELHDTQYLGYKITKSGKVWSNVSNRFLSKQILISKGYCYYNVKSFGKHKKLLLARTLMIIFNPCDDMYKLYVDHIDGNKLNNDLSNLRWATPSDNARNSIWKTGKSGYRGVHYLKRDGTYRASITLNGKTKHLGVYINKEDAAREYDRACILYHGKFGKLNFK